MASHHRRRRNEDEHENHERWLVSYADFITLLFAFFVVMYAISQVNDGKYRVLSDTLSSAFRTPGGSSGALVQINPNAPSPLAIPVRKNPAQIKAEENKRQNKEKMRNMAKELMDALGPLVQNGQVRVTEGAMGITIEINASVLFPTGEARLDITAVRALVAVAQILGPTEFPVTVEGHTDNAPINTPQFPSNWELSGARAASVVRLFIDSGVDPRRMTALGFADQRPVADNAVPEGRSRNRRVAINIEANVPDKVVEVPVEGAGAR
ncbi:MAG: flagellar motor protein MotD [Gammaproteobacteria bacterium]|nr:flagellar motor protein MotD [Gammaproteobacteria bacterium]MBU1646164.1 flagellar motor protein MotD [Gammaproteobacteria bacterium]MBU1972226.1 flagellar motor protein MotD [Gammaproteobacteria bacterium]